MEIIAVSSSNFSIWHILPALCLARSIYQDRRMAILLHDEIKFQILSTSNPLVSFDQPAIL